MSHPGYDFLKKMSRSGLDVSGAEVDKFFSSAEVQMAVDEMLTTGNPTLTIGVAKTGGLKLIETGKVSLEGSGIYFMRINPSGVRQKEAELDIAYGEIPRMETLQSFDTVLGRVYGPLLKAQDDWGQCKPDASGEVLESLHNLGVTLGEAIENVNNGVRLDPPDKAIMDKVENRQKSFETSVTNTAVVGHCVEMLKRWSDQISGLITDSETRSSKSKDIDEGPRSELQYWRMRAQKFSNIIDQLQTVDFRKVFGVIKEAKEFDDEASKVLKKWRMLDNSVTDVSNEAKDNLKYLGTLDKYLDVLYSGTVTEVREMLPGMLNNVKMMQQISRYYNTPERMTTLYVKISNQIISNARMNVTSKGKLWDQNCDDVTAHLNLVRNLYNSYLELYEVTKNKTAITSSGKACEEFSLDETVIFGRIEMFIKRVEKCVEIFSTISQFSLVCRKPIEGMDEVTVKFGSIVEDMRRKPYDILDFNKQSFEMDFLSFKAAIADLESILQGFINSSFETIPSTAEALNLLSKFQKIIKRDVLVADLEQKQMVVFQNYGLDLDFVQRTYEKFKGAPTLVRTMPPVAGNITWSRQLLRRIEQPMVRFSSSAHVMSTKESKKIIKTYNTVASALIEFETLWHQAWCQSIDAATAGLHATLIVKHPGNVRMYANFDPELLQLIREAKCLISLGVNMPEAAKMLLMQDEKYKTQHNTLSFTLKEYERVVGRINPVIKAILSYFVRNLEQEISPGLLTITWTSLAINEFLEKMNVSIAKLDDLLTKINDIVESRIETNIKIISKTLLVDLDEEKFPFAVEDFVQVQDAHIKEMSAYIDSKNLEVELAVLDILEVVELIATTEQHKANPNAEPIKVTSKQSAESLVKHYNRLMYNALLTTIKASYTMIKKRVFSGGAGGGLLGVMKEGKEQQAPPFFKSLIELELGPTAQVLMRPSLADIQDVINRAAISILRATKRVISWGQATDVARRTQGGSFFEELATEKEIAKYVLMLTGALLGARLELDAYLLSFDKFAYLWTKNIQNEYNSFIDKNPSLEDFDDRLCFYIDVEKEVDKIRPVNQIGVIAIELSVMKQTLFSFTNLWKSQYTSNLVQIARDDLNTLLEYMGSNTRKFNMTVTSLDDVRKVMQMMSEVREKESVIEWDFGPLEEKFELLQRYGVKSVTGDELYAVRDLRKNWTKLKALTESVGDDLGTRQMQFKKDLVQNMKRFKTDIHDYRSAFEKQGPGVLGISPDEAISRLARAEREFGDFDRKYASYNAGETLFGMPVTNLDAVTKTRKELKLLKQLYGLYETVDNTMSEYNEILWVDVLMSVEEMTTTVNEFQRLCKNMPRALKDWPAYTDLKQKIEDLLETVPLLQYLSNKAMRSRHWEAVENATNSKFNMDPDTFKVGNLLEARLIKVAEEIEEISAGATKELNIEMKLREIEGLWSDQVLSFAGYKGRSGIWILKGGEAGEIQEALEESLMNLGGMASSRYALPFKDDVDLWLSKLSETSEVMERWLYLQMLWMNLEAVFTGGDIAKQLPQDSKRFVAIDKTWNKLMSKAVETRYVVGLCYNNDMLKFLAPLIEGLELCQKSLASYLEAKRALFPRFYFVADPTLLEILSQGSDPPAIQPYFQACFDSIDFVTFDEKNKKNIIKINASLGSEDEVVDLTTAVVAEGNIEDWMFKIELEMRASLHDIIRQASVDCISQDIKTFISGYNAQTCLLGIQLQWTIEGQEAINKFKSDKKALEQNKDKVTKLMTDLCIMTTDDTLGKRDRRNIETLITIEVHQKDVFDDVFKKKLKDPTDFFWMSQLRFYYRTDIDNTSCECCDRAFPYCYEFLGCEERLVITPLTDKCYVSLTQALGMIKGGAPAGPAGTGKTETTKDLARGLGKYCVVTNCGPEMDIKATGKIYKGLAMCGAWGCFDEFNRIDLEVLSVCAQQIACVLNAIKDKVKTFVFLDGQVLAMNPDVGYFITMNPGYAGRQELPENLKALFRGVMMMVPDRQIIMKVKLAAAGYQQYQPLSVKFHVLYSLCEQQLSKQPHYDFGLRNILSVLRTAGAQLRTDKIEVAKGAAAGIKREPRTESYLLCRTLRDMNMSKFVAEDVGLFVSLINDLFPGLNPEKAVFPEIERAIAECCVETGLQLHPQWLGKIIQLYETYLVRHGIMVVGAAGSGKTMITYILRDTLTKIVVKHTTVKMNPKAITPKQMYGFQDPIANEWSEGTFTALWRKSNDPRKKGVNPWMVMDGPVDAIWIEDLNTVLDDNRMLTVANGDRIPMSQNMKIMFEPEDLRNASPATVSRAGIIYVSSTDLGWQPILDKYVTSRINAKEKEILPALFAKYLVPGIKFNTESGAKQLMPVVDMNLVTTFLTLLSGILPELKEKDEPISVQKYERVIIMACLWSTGALFELSDRVKYQESIQSIPNNQCPVLKTEGQTIYDFTLDDKFEWGDWQLTKLVADPNKFDFASLLVPTMDSVRMHYFMHLMLDQKRPVLLVGGPGTAKSSVSMMYIENQPKSQYIFKNINFSSATTCQIFQNIIESTVEKRSGKIFGPPANKKLICFLDDVSMPEINVWGDQPTLEVIRQIIELQYLWNLEKGKAGEQQLIEDLIYILAMNHPGGGKNDIPHRMKRHCANWNVPMPSMASIHQIFGSILKLRFTEKDFTKAVLDVAEGLVDLTMDVYEKAKAKLLPTPAKFHYIFNLRDVSRVFQGLMTIPLKVLLNPTNTSNKSDAFLLCAWRHECLRVYQDKLITQEDKDWLDKTLVSTISARYENVISRDKVEVSTYLVDFLQNAPTDPETGEPSGPRPKVYEQVADLDTLRNRAQTLMDEMNDGLKVGKMFLVLFDDAVKHMARISRIIMMPRGSALLVGVGGSGKQSLTRLATYIATYQRFQVTVSKTYNTNNLLEDIRGQYAKAGLAKPVTFVFTDAEVKEEGFLEYINMILSTGEIPGLIPKDEMEALIGECSGHFEKEFPGVETTRVGVIKYFYSRVRAHLHIVLCFSPVGSKFRDRALKFPALFSGTTIDWFLPWPQQALERVANAFLSDFPVKVDNDKMKKELVNNIANTHLMVTSECENYFAQFRRNVYVTPKSYLSFIDAYKQVYKKKFDSINDDAEKITNGLIKLAEAEEDVAKMKVELGETEKILAKTGERIEKMVVNLKEKAGKAEKVKAEVLIVKNDLSEVAAKIGADRDETNRDLEAAKPALIAAENALDAIKPDDIKSLKALKNPPNIIKRIMDGVIILKREMIDPVKIDPEVKTKGGNDTILSSFGTAAKMMNNPKFLDELKGFNTDTITEETCELMFPYLEMDDFTTEMAAKASGNVSGLCDWCRAMVSYYFIAKFVAPKIEALKVAEAQLQVANASLAVAEGELSAKERELKGLNDEFDAAMAEKQKTQDEADLTMGKMQAANQLINGLSGEKVRWTAQSKEFASTIRKLVGDVSLCCGFVSYCGPFNGIFRDKLLLQRFRGDCEERGIPLSGVVEPVKFLLDEARLTEFALEGLPTDKLSLENGLMTTRATRWPIMIDPQNQANTWIKNREGPNNLITTTLSDKRFRTHLEGQMADGAPLLIQHIEQEVDPVLDPVLNKLIIRSGRILKINLPDKEGCDYNDKFRLYFTTKLANPHYTPELSAQTTIIDFTVTMQGLEDQLLSLVVLQERPDLEDQRQKLGKEIAMYKTKVLELEAQLLFKLANVQGNLLDDKDILDVLNNTKVTSVEVAEKLKAASETQSNIQVTCEDYRQVATRGSIIYFLFTECSLIDPMYQNSLKQFLELFDIAMHKAELNPSVGVRCKNIIEESSLVTWFYFTRGVFERHKLLYTLLLTIKIALKDGLIKSDEFGCLLKGGAALDLKSQKRKPADWMPDNSWLNLCQLGLTFPVFRDITNTIIGNAEAWHDWFDFEDPEAQPIPDFQGRISVFQKLCLLRAFREDRTMVVMKEYIGSSIGKKYLKFPPLDIEAAWAESTTQVPLIFLLSPGSSPDEAIAYMAKKKKIRVDAISMGQGQEIKAAEMMKAAIVNGSWVLLQNTHLGLAYMRTLEGYLNGLEDCEPNFRLWITSEPHPLFPIGLLQISIKMTDEPPSGMKAGLWKSYNSFLTQDWLEAVNRDEWRPLLYALCFLHSIVQERRKFGALGFCIPYEFNGTDLDASALYLRTHMTEVELKKGEPNWSAITYMVCEVQYGGRITDTLDKVLFATYGQQLLTPKIFEASFEFSPGYKCQKFSQLSMYHEAIELMAPEDHPNVFGMHGNADLTYRSKTSKEMLETIMNIQPKDSGGGGDGGPTRDEVVLMTAGKMLNDMPKNFNMVEVRKNVEKLNGGADKQPKPLNIHLKQEIDRMQIIIGLTRKTLQGLELAIAGTVIMTPDLADCGQCLFDARVPAAWLKKSWVAPTLGLWFGSGLCSRTTELITWLNDGRPKSFWLTGYFNAQGFLTAVQQEVTRRHQGWSLDDIQVYTEVTPMEKDDVEKKERLEEGVYVWGLFLEAAAWDKKRNSLVDAPPKKLFCPVPCMMVTAIKRDGKKSADYSAPCYTIPKRTGQFYVFNANIRTETPAAGWTLRGTALLCSKD